MKSEKFTIGFILVFSIILAILFFVYRKFSGDNSEGGVWETFWFALILLFLLFGIIVISLYMNHMKSRKFYK